MPASSERKAALSREEREKLVLDAAAELFYARGVHEVGMDELIRATGLGKATVYRLFATKDELIAAYLQRLSANILAAIDQDLDRHAHQPADAIDAIFRAIATDVSRAGFRGCAFNNASIEFADPQHPARIVAREYRESLLQRLRQAAEALRPETGKQLADQLALIIDGMYVNAAHLGPQGPALAGPRLARALVERGGGGGGG